MSNHSLSTAEDDGIWQTWCECGADSGPVPHHWQADDWAATHLAQVDRVRAHLRSHHPSLRDQRDWYRSRALTADTEHDRNLWTLLADGLDHRLGHQVEEQPLFEENA